MTKQIFGQFSTCIRYKSSQVAWDDGCAQWYFVKLRDIPDSDSQLLYDAVDTLGKFRPDPLEIITLWRNITQDRQTPELLVSQIYALREKYGEYVCPDPNFGGLRKAGEPTWTDDDKRRVIAAFGGWVNFCRDDSPAGVQRGQLLKIAASVLGSESDQALAELRREYQELNAPALDITPEPGGMVKVGALTNGAYKVGALTNGAYD